MTVWNLAMAVTEDLYTFARGALLSVFVKNDTSYVPAAPFALPPSVHMPEEVEEIPHSFRSTSDVISDRLRPEKNTVMYIGADEVPVYMEPTRMFDGIIARLSYGALVMVLEVRGKWARVVYKDLTGWTERDELIDRAAYVYPEFTIGEANASEDANTLRVRATIQDEFGGGAAELPLQSAEYVLYKLYRKGISLSWPAKRPRLEGAWHEILRGNEKVHISIHPEVGSIMEYLLEDGRGHLAYVEAVFPDETMTISESNYPDDGIYNERVLTREEWRELKPIFLKIA